MTTGIVLLCLVVSVLVICADRVISTRYESYLFDRTEDVPHGHVALVLGTAWRLKGGNENPYFKYRIDAAAELYRSGRIRAVVVSGDNSRKSYNEPEAMRSALVAAGVPDSLIYLDYAGFRTLDSVIRMHRIFGQESFVVVSQKFHNERAVFIARHMGLDVYGHNAVDLSVNRISLRTKIREKFARVKVFVDILIGKKPKFLGEPVHIN